VQDGVRIEEVSKLLRHSNVTTTDKYYAHLTAEHGSMGARHWADCNDTADMVPKEKQRKWEKTQP